MSKHQPDQSGSGLLFAVLVIGVMAYALVLALVSPVLPTIQRDLGTTHDMIAWVMTGCLVSAAVFTPILGRIGDRIGKRRVIVVSLLILAAGSFVAAASPNVGVMIVGRVLQGAGGGVVPLAFSVIRDAVPREQVPRAVGMLSALYAVSGGLAAVLSGPVSTALGYRALFWIPGLVTLVAAAGAHRLIPASPHRQPGPVNWGAAFLLSAWLVALLVPLAQGSTWGWSTARVIAPLIASAVLLVAWIRVESRSASPLIDMRMMRLPAVWTTNAIALLFGLGMYALLASLPYFVQTPSSAGYGFGVSQTQAGLTNLPMTVAMFVAGLISAKVSARLSARRLLLGSTLISTVGFALLAFVHSEYAVVLVAMAVIGFGFGLAFATMTSLIINAVPSHQTGAATGMNANIRTIGGAFGTAIVGNIITAHTLPGGLPAESGYIWAFATLALAALAASAVALLIPRLGQTGGRAPGESLAGATKAADTTPA